MKAIHPCRWLLLAGAAAGVSGVAGSASAITLPPGYDYVSSQTAAAGVEGEPVGQQTSSTVGSVGAAESSPASAVGPGAAKSSGSIAITPSPAISAKASVSFVPPGSAFNTHDGTYGSNASYSGNLTYYFEISGPTSSVAVNAKAVASYSTSSLPSGGEANGAVNLLLTQLDPVGDPVNPRVILDSRTFALGSYSSPSAAQSGGFTESGTYDLLTDTIYQVALQVIANVAIRNAGASDPGSLGGSAGVLASLDPIFQIASSVADPSGYHFVFSDGIGNSAIVSATPLPAALPLFATAFGVLGLLGWRKRRHDACAA
jgi:hypothetical protein